MGNTASQTTPMPTDLASPQVGFQPQVSMWVQLRDCPSSYGFDEALLLCEYAEGQWVAWVPDFGQILLNLSDFYRLS